MRKSFVELLAASGLDSPEKINRSHIYRRVNMGESLRYDQLYPLMSEGCLSKGACPVRFEVHMKEVEKNDTHKRKATLGQVPRRPGI